jgi:microcystin-dependent protein
MSDQYLGEIRMFGCNFAPFQWAFCDGQILPISQNTALFSLLGTNYGGNGTSNFALPNLQGLVPLHQGNGVGLSPYSVGEQVGVSSVTLLTTEMPAHAHQAHGAIEAGDDTNTPAANTTLGLSAPDPIYSKVATDPLVQFSPKAIQPTGNNLPHQNMQPYLAINFCIAMAGAFPARN